MSYDGNWGKPPWGQAYSAGIRGRDGSDLPWPVVPLGVALPVRSPHLHVCNSPRLERVCPLPCAGGRIVQSRCWSCPQCHIQGTLVGKSLGAAAVSRAFPVLTGSWWLPRANVNKKITVLGGTPENRSLQMSAEEILAAFFFFFFTSVLLMPPMLVMGCGCPGRQQRVTPSEGLCLVGQVVWVTQSR